MVVSVLLLLLLLLRCCAASFPCVPSRAAARMDHLQDPAAAAPRNPVKGETDRNEDRLRAAAERAGLRMLSLPETTKEASRLLLAGWKMTADMCPVTEYPLFEKDGKLWSVRLGTPVARDAASAGASASASASASRAGGLTTGAGITPLGRPVVEPTQRMQDDVEEAEDDDATSQRIAEKLLQGWILLEESCPVTFACPLMRDPTTGRKWSPALGEFVGDAATTAATPTRGGVPADSPDRKLVSKRIGEKLLQGWIMTDQVCPVTGMCPLMQDPESKRMYSAATDGFVDSLAKSASGAEGATTQAPTQKVASTPAKPLPPPHQRQEQQHPPPSSRTTPPTSVDDVASVVHRKLQGWAAALDVATDAATCRELMALMRDAATLLRELQSLPA